MADVHKVGELPLPVDQEEGSPSVAESVQGLQTGQLHGEIESFVGGAAEWVGAGQGRVRARR